MYAYCLNKLLPFIKDSIIQKDIDDYNFDADLSVFSKDKAINAKYDVEEGDSIIEIGHWILPLDKEDQEFFLENDWNEWRNGIPEIKHLRLCYAMHAIWESGLSIEDILEIDDVWMNMRVDFQSFIKKDDQEQLYASNIKYFEKHF